MSHSYFNEKWQHAVERLNEQVEIENPEENKLQLNGNTQWNDLWQHYTHLYIRYVQIFRQLEECYDQMVHPQKRMDVKSGMKTVMARLIMLKAQLKAFGYKGTKMEYLNLDEQIMDLKLLPQDLEAVKAMYILKRCMKLQAETVPAEEALPDLGHRMDRAEAIRIIQRNERGRQGRLRAKMMRLYRLEEKKAQEAANPKEEEGLDLKSATTALVLGHLGRSKVRKMRQRELKFLGMRSPVKPFERVKSEGEEKPRIVDSIFSKKNLCRIKSEAKKKMEEYRLQRKKQQAYNEREFGQQLQALQSKVKVSDIGEMKDELWQERYQWFVEQKRTTGKYPTNWTNFYREKHLNSLTPEQKLKFLAKQEEEKKKAEAGGGGKKGKKGKKGKDKKDKKGKKKKGKKGKGGGEPPASILAVNPAGPVPELVDLMHETVTKYKSTWSTLDETENFNQGYDKGIAEETAKRLVRAEITPNWDDQLLAYLQNIVNPGGGGAKKAGKKGKKAKKGGKKTSKKEGGEKKKSSKGGSKSKKKKKAGGKSSKGKQYTEELFLKDVPPEDHLMHMIKQLLQNGILKKLETPKPLNDLIGDANLIGMHYQKQNAYNAPSMAQLRACVTLHGILPLGEQEVKNMQAKGPGGLCKAILLAGPKGTGKTHIAKAIAGHTNAIWMDISPTNIMPKIKNKKHAQALAYMCFEVARQFSEFGKPTVMYMDEAERFFAKKKVVTKIAETRARFARFCKQDFIGFKDIFVEESKKLSANKVTSNYPRVLIVGNTCKPNHEFTEKKEFPGFFKKTGNKLFFTPLPNYDTRLLIWKHYINRASLDSFDLSANKKFSLSILAHISSGYSAGNIRNAVMITLPDAKVENIQKQVDVGRTPNLTTNDFVSALSKLPFMFKEDYGSFVQYMIKQIPGEVDRRKLEANPEALKEQKKAGKKGKKGKKKKK
eukprot:jgi/Bigna1/142761/aug1.72_g17469